MPFEVQQGEDTTVLTLSGRIGVQQARPLWDALNQTLSAGRGIRLQAEAVEAIDTSIVQILCLIGRRRGELHIVSTSDGFIASLARRGLEGFFAYSEPEKVAPTPPEVQPLEEPKRPSKKKSAVVVLD